MSDVVLDSSVLAKLVLPEPDSPSADRVADDVASRGDRLVVLDLAFAEVANAIWKRRRQRLLDDSDARMAIAELLRFPVHVEPAARLLPQAFEIASRYDRAVYDALFVAVTADLRAEGLTADEPLWSVVRKDFPSVKLLRDYP